MTVINEDESWQSRLDRIDILSFTFKNESVLWECFDYAFTSVKYMIVLAKHQVPRPIKIA